MHQRYFSTLEQCKHYCPLCTRILLEEDLVCPECDNPAPEKGWPLIARSSYSLLGTRIDSFIFDRFLGAGASAVVYRAVSPNLPRPLAAKIFNADRYSKPKLNQELLDRFVREIEALNRLDNPHIISIYNVVDIRASSYAFFMSYASGTTLQQFLDRVEQLPLLEALRVTRQVASALFDLHVLGYLHCDVKPENVMLQRFNPFDLFARVIDFGLLRRIGEERSPYAGFRGSPLYASPEQCRVDKYMDERSDVYALGCLLFHAISGHPPFSGKTDLAVIQAQVNQPPPVLSDVVTHFYVSPRLSRLVSSMLEKDMTKRPRHMVEVMQAIDQILIYDVADRFGSDRQISVAQELTLHDQALNQDNLLGSQKLVQILTEYIFTDEVPPESRKFSTVAFYDRRRVILADHHHNLFDVSCHKGGAVRCTPCSETTISAVAYMTRSKHVVAIDLMQDVWSWYLESGDRPKAIVRLSERVYAIANGSREDEFIIGKESGEITLISLATKSSRVLAKGHAMVAAIAMASIEYGIGLVSFWDHSISLLNLNEGTTTQLAPTKSVAISTAVSPDGKIGAALTQKHGVRVYDLDKPHVYYDIMTTDAKLLKITFGPNGELLGISVDQVKIRFWDINISAIRQIFREA